MGDQIQLGSIANFFIIEDTESNKLNSIFTAYKNGENRII